MPLTDNQIKALKPAGAAKKYSDGEGLHLLVTPTGSKLWRLSYRFDGKQKLLAFGVYPSTSLANARKKREDLHLFWFASTAHLSRSIQRSRGNVERKTKYHSLA
jgi:hypothetical protein